MVKEKNIMSKYAIEYIESLRFERVNDDGTKTVFSVEEPKSIGLTNPRSILTDKHGVQIGGVNHCWDEVFSSKTKIILVGAIIEKKEMMVIKQGSNISDFLQTKEMTDVRHYGEFDFEELCKGRLVKITD